MSSGPTITMEGIQECVKAFSNLEGELRRNANGDLRQASKQIAAGMQRILGGSGAPQEDAILAAAAPKSDRYVVLAVPSRKPRLSGLRGVPAAQAKTIGFAVESGSDEPQFRGAPKGGMVFRHRRALMAYAVPRYQRAMVDIMKRYGLL